MTAAGANGAPARGPEATSGHGEDPDRPELSCQRVLRMRELAERIASYLEGNEVALGLRLVCRDLSAALNSPAHTIIQCSQRLPPHVLQQHWLHRPSALHALPARQRRKLLAAAARTGDTAVLGALFAAAGIPVPSAHEVFAAAAAAGQLGVCEWLLERGCPPSTAALHAAAAAGQLRVLKWLFKSAGGERCPGWGRTGLAAAARGGHRDTCAWVLEHGGCSWDPCAPAEAAAAGRTAALGYLLQQHAVNAGRRSVDRARLVAGGAYGLDARTFEQLHATWALGGYPGSLPSYERAGVVERALVSRAGVVLQGRGCSALASALSEQGQVQEVGAGVEAGAGAGVGAGVGVGAGGGQGLGDAVAVSGAALQAATDDALAKAELLLQHGYPTAGVSCTGVGALPDAHLRLPRLHALGFSVHHAAVLGAAAAAGQAAAVSYLLDAGVVPDGGAATAVAAGGYLALLQLLHARGVPMHGGVAAAAASGGHAGCVRWLLRVLPEDELRGVVGGLATCAAQSGRLEMMRVAEVEGWPLGPRAWAGAAKAGSVEVLDWLAARSSPMQTDGLPYVAAAHNGDLLCLQRLRDLQVPWGPGPATFTRAVWEGGACAPLPVLQWLVGAGCPVEWEAAARAARQRLERGVASPPEKQESEAVLAWLAKRQQGKKQGSGA